MRYFSEAESYQIGLLRNLFIVAQISGQTYLPFYPVLLLEPSVLGLTLPASTFP